MLNIEPSFNGKYALLHTGFRPFFLLAMLSAIVLGVIWMGLYSFGWMPLRSDYPPVSWHAHEMLFGYTVAVVSGFLLTAVRNWTGLPTVAGLPLLVLALIWLFGRILPFIPVIPLWYLALHEALFLCLLLYVTAAPIVARRQWGQVAILGKLALLIPASLLFYLGLMGVWQPGVKLGLYLAFYLVIGLILTMGRRVIPSFIENTVRDGFKAFNNVWLDRLSLFLFLLFAGADIYSQAFGSPFATLLAAMLALALFPLHVARLSGWYHRGLWQHPLLWSLYVAYGWTTFALLLKFMSVALGVNLWVAVHAFAYGGIGLVTLGMMARVALGHTGRNVFVPPAVVGMAAALLVGGAFIRVILVWLLPGWYAMWILAAQLVWLAAFGLLLAYYLPILVQARVDGRYG